MEQLPSSYRDAAGFLFKDAGRLYRYISPAYTQSFQDFTTGGLYGELVKKNWLVKHELCAGHEMAKAGGLVIQPEYIPFISYPYEWSFDMWRDAAILTLDIARLAIKKKMILKDATPFNIQFVKGKPIFIDSLSFEPYEEAKPWVAYRQFCEAFLGPMLLMHYQHPDLARLFSVYPGGIPLDQLVTMLPARSAFNINSYLHIHLQAKFAAHKNNGKGKTAFSKRKMEVLLSGLQGYVRGLKAKKVKTTWDDYYSGTISGNDYLNAKTLLVNSFTEGIDIDIAIDLGANDGHFSFLLKDKAAQVIAMDSDANAVNQLYHKVKAGNISTVLPLLNDLSNPAPSIGWNNKERVCVTERLRGDLVMALALVHHLAIGKNIPLGWIATYLQPMSPWLLIEFVPKTDEKVKLLLAGREDIFSEYTVEHFRSAFGKYYSIEREATIGNTGRILFLMKRR